MSKVVVVDDHAESLSRFCELLKCADYSVTGVSSGRECLRSLTQARGQNGVSLVLLDIVMPEMDGLTTLRAIKAIAHHVDTPVIMVSNSEDVGRLTEAFSLGAFDYVKKPVVEAELLARVRSALHLSGEIKQRKDSEAALFATAQRLEEANEQLTLLVCLDCLTGIPNRRHLADMMAREWRSAIREEENLAMVMFDIDCFKAYNDHFGHPQGDHCLKQVAITAQKSAMRPRDLVARYGGEEFVMVLPKTCSQKALIVAERFKQELNNLAIPHPKSAVSEHITVSMGIASCQPESKQSVEMLLGAADAAMYEAKRSGRDRIALASE